MRVVTFEIVAPITINRSGERVSLKRGARVKIDMQAHDFSEEQLRRAIREGKLQAVPLAERPDRLTDAAR